MANCILFYHGCDVLQIKLFIVFSGYDTRRLDSIFYGSRFIKFIKNSYPNVNIMLIILLNTLLFKGGAQMQTTKNGIGKKTPKSVLQHEAEMKYWNIHKYDFTLVGMTASEDEIKKFKMDVDTGHGVIELRRHRNRDEILMSTTRHILYSFVKQDKSYVKMMYEKYNVLDKLFPLTASCIGFQKQITVKSLRNCVWCKERLWAFGEEHLQ